MSIAIDRLINARVVCRIRPLTQSEKKAGGHSCIDYTTSCIEVYNSLGHHPFDCDHIFDETSTQQDVFDYSARPHIDDALAGINSTIIAYGQTSSGKTYTIDGDPSNAIDMGIDMGIVPRTVVALFEAAAMRSSTMQFTLKMSYIEIYMEKVKDLLSEESTSSTDAQSTVKIIGVNVTEKKVTSFDQFMKHWKAGKSSTTNFAFKSYI
jgi:kinesin family member 5